MEIRLTGDEAAHLLAERVAEKYHLDRRPTYMIRWVLDVDKVAVVEVLVYPIEGEEDGAQADQ